MNEMYYGEGIETYRLEKGIFTAIDENAFLCPGDNSPRLNKHKNSTVNRNKSANLTKILSTKENLQIFLKDRIKMSIHLKLLMVILIFIIPLQIAVDITENSFIISGITTIEKDIETINIIQERNTNIFFIFAQLLDLMLYAE
jgi:hypothetical protein